MKSLKILALLFSVIFSTNALSKADSATKVAGATTIDAAEAKKLWLAGATFIDTRKGSDWDAGRVPGAIHINVKKSGFTAEGLQAKIALDNPVVSYCNAEKCHRSSKGAKKLVSYGYTNVYYFRSGFPAWKNAGYPYE